jgi:hypothetical protein
MTTTETATQTRTLTVTQLVDFLDETLTAEEGKNLIYELLTTDDEIGFEHCDNDDEYWKAQRVGDLFKVWPWDENDV